MTTNTWFIGGSVAMGTGDTVGVGKGAGFTVNVTLLLVTVPALLLTITAKTAPLSASVIAGVV